jgi:hypothetical protein
MRTGVMGALAATLVFCAAGCERRPAVPPDPAPATPAAGTVQITVHVKGMTKALNIT